MRIRVAFGCLFALALAPSLALAQSSQPSPSDSDAPPTSPPGSDSQAGPGSGESSDVEPVKLVHAINANPQGAAPVDPRPAPQSAGDGPTVTTPDPAPAPDLPTPEISVSFQVSPNQNAPASNAQTISGASRYVDGSFIGKHGEHELRKAGRALVKGEREEDRGVRLIQKGERIGGAQGATLVAKGQALERRGAAMEYRGVRQLERVERAQAQRYARTGYSKGYRSGTYYRSSTRASTTRGGRGRERERR